MNLRLKENWDQFIELYQKSGLTKADFCRSQKVTESQFYYYIKFHRGKNEHEAATSGSAIEKKSNFIPVAIQKEFKIKINDSIGLTFESLPEPAWMASLIKFMGNDHAAI